MAAFYFIWASMCVIMVIYWCVSCGENNYTVDPENIEGNRKRKRNIKREKYG